MGGEAKTIPTDGRMIQVLLVFQAPTNEKFKVLRLKLPPAAFHGEGPMICYEINATVIKPATSAGASAKTVEGDSGGTTTKNDKK